MLSVKQGSIIFWAIGIIQPGIEPQSSRALKNTLPTRPNNELKLSELFEIIPIKKNVQNFLLLLNIQKTYFY